MRRLATQTPRKSPEQLDRQRGKRRETNSKQVQQLSWGQTSQATQRIMKSCVCISVSVSGFSFCYYFNVDVVQNRIDYSHIYHSILTTLKSRYY